MLHYILQTILFQLLFLLMYEFLLKKETFFTYNRWYLILTPLLSLILPLLKFETLGEMVPAETFVLLPEVYLGTSGGMVDAGEAVNTTTEADPLNWWSIAYAAGFGLSLLLFIKKFLVLRSLFKYEVVKQEKTYRVIQVRDSNLACTFFNTVFLGDRLKKEEIDQILSHEIVHVRQKHSADLLYFELLKIMFWFNPLIYIYQARISTLHEFIADAGVVKTVGKKTYYQQLLNTAFSTENISFINQFFNQSLIKKRIVMLQKSRSKTISKVKYLILVPLMLAMLTYVSCSQDAEVNTPQNDVTVSEAETLKAAYREELLQMQENGAEFMEIADAFNIEKNAHIRSKEAYYRSQVYMEHMIEKMAERNQENGNFNPEMLERMKSNLNRTYEEYVAQRKSETPNTTVTRTEVEESVGDVPFAVIEEVPIFPGCEGLTGNAERKACMSEKITEFINQNFKTALGKELGLKGINRIYVQFRINPEGGVDVLGARAPHPALEEEATRVVNQLPQMIPGKQKGQEVGVLYSLPITFNAGE